MLRAMLLPLLFAAPVLAADPVTLATEAYLDDAEPFGMIAKSAGGGPKGWASLRAIAWYPALDGKGNDDGGGEFDIQDDLGIDDNELAVVPQLTLNFWILGFRMDYFSVEYEGRGTLQRGFTFGGITFVTDENVSSVVRLENFRSLGFIRVLDTDAVRLFGILGFQYYDYEATITGETTGTATIDGILPYPVIGLLVQLRFGDLLLEAEGSGFYVDYSDIEATALDFTVSAAWNFLKFGEARVGYRFVSVDGTIEDTTLDLRLDGFFVSVGVNF